MQQGFIDMEKMFVLLEVEPEIKDAHDATQVRHVVWTVEIVELCHSGVGRDSSVSRHTTLRRCSGEGERNQEGRG